MAPNDDLRAAVARLRDEWRRHQEHYGIDAVDTSDVGCSIVLDEKSRIYGEHADALTALLAQHPPETAPTREDLTAPARYVYPSDALYPVDALRMAYANGLAAGQRLAALASRGDASRAGTCATCGAFWRYTNGIDEPLQIGTCQLGVRVSNGAVTADFGCNQWAGADAPKET